MPSFILRNLDPVFWGRVQAKADAEGTTVYNLIVHLLKQWLAAVLLLSTIACGYENPTQPSLPVVQPTPGVPTRIELTANAGIGEEAGSGRINARVLDGLSHGLPGVTVTFTAAGGTLGVSQVVTDGTGSASTTITGPAGPIAISAIVGTVEQKTQIAIQAVPPPPPPPSVPPPAPPRPAPVPTPPAPIPAPEFTVKLTTTVSSVPAGTAIDFVATVTNPGGEIIQAYQWDLDGDGKFEFTTVVPTRQSAPLSDPGIHTAKVQVTSTSNRTASGTVTYVVTTP